MSNNNPLDILNSLSLGSISGIFQEMIGGSKQTSTNGVTLHDTEGSDFRRLANKKKQRQQNIETITVTTNTKLKSNNHSVTTTTTTGGPVVSTINTRFSNRASPDFRPVVYLESPPPQPSKSSIGRSLYSLLFQHEDRYFNNDRKELSQDIFPVGKGPST